MTITVLGFFLSLALFAAGGFLIGYIVARSGPTNYNDED